MEENISTPNGQPETKHSFTTMWVVFIATAIFTWGLLALSS